MRQQLSGLLNATHNRWLVCHMFLLFNIDQLDLERKQQILKTAAIHLRKILAIECNPQKWLVCHAFLQALVNCTLKMLPLNCPLKLYCLNKIPNRKPSPARKFVHQAI